MYKNTNIYDKSIFHDESNDTFGIKSIDNFFYKFGQIRNHLTRYYARIVFFSGWGKAVIRPVAVSFYFCYF